MAPLTGAGSISIADSNNAPANAINVALLQSNNVTGAGAFTLTNVNNVTIVNAGNIGLAGTIAASGNVTLTAGGRVTLPDGSLTLGSLTVSANLTTIVNNITTTSGDIAFTGAVSFLAARHSTLPRCPGPTFLLRGTSARTTRSLLTCPRPERWT